MFLDLHVGRLIEPSSGRAWEREEIERRVAERAGYYHAHGFAHGHRAFIHFGNSNHFFVELLAIWRCGGCAIPVDPRFTPFEIATLAAWAKPRLSLWDRSPESDVADSLSKLGVEVVDVSAPDHTSQRGAPRLANVRLDDDALILFTSGTTGQPKGVVHTHRSLLAQWSNLRAHLRGDSFRRTLCLLPTHFGHGLICNCLFPWLSGNDLIMLPPFKPELVSHLGATIDEHGATFMSSVPAVWRLALRIAKPPKSRTLQRVFVGSAPLSASLWESIQAWSGTPQVCNAYGITETASWLAGTTVPQFRPEDGLVGVAWGGVVRVLKSKEAGTPSTPDTVCARGEAGHVWVRTPALMRGYLDRDDLTAQVVSDGWFSTGDIGAIDERGWLYLRGREREEINKGGMKVHPADVDAVIERFADTVDVCTFAFPDPLLGEEVGVAVVMSKRDDDSLRGLLRWVRTHLAVHQVPQRWYVLDEIPRTSRGKVSRTRVAELCLATSPLNVAALLREALGGAE
jgi:acyl-CoA synthetase (AMP-forming)/AMP-acid ligase II